MSYIDLNNMECEEAMMTIRFYIRTNKMTAGDSLSIHSQSETFWTLVTSWASSFEHIVSREPVEAGGWVARITLN